MTRRQIRRTVLRELRNIRSYRREDAPDEHERAWIRVGDEMLDMLRQEPDGEARAHYANAYFGITIRPKGNKRYVNTWAAERFSISEDGLRRWREAAVYNASVLAFVHHAIDLSDDP